MSLATYRRNVRAWREGFDRFAEIRFKPGWTASSRRWWLLYALDYGTRVLTGGACVSWSRWFHDRRESYGHAAFITRLLDRLDPRHGAQAGPILWGTADTGMAVAGSVLFWFLAVPATVWGLFAIIRRIFA